MTDPIAARQAAKVAERERLARARERQESQEPSRVSGFVQRKWRWLGVGGSEAVEAVLAMLAETVAVAGTPEAERAVLTRALAGDPDREDLLPAVRTGLSHLPSASVLGHMRNLWGTGVRWLNEAGLERCRLLCSTAPGLDLVSKRSHAVTGGPAFSLFATAATRGAIPIPNRFLDGLLAWAPLTVIDDLVDHSGLLAEDAPWKARDQEESLYLRARLAPEKVTDEEARRLGWQAYLRRQSFLRGETLTRQEPDDVWDLLYDVVLDGDVAAWDALDAVLPRAQQIELRDLKSGAVSGQWPPSMGEDRGLWRLMSTLWKPRELVDAGRSPFYALVAVNRAYDLVRAGEMEAAALQAHSLTRGGSGRKVPAELVQEGYAIAAYAAVEGERLESATGRDRLLDSAEEYAEKAAAQGGAVAERNFRLLRAWRETRRNYRGPFSNPFLEIGLDHGADGWEERCRGIFRQCEGDAKAQSALNLAEERIRGALRDEAGWDVFYRLPLAPSRYVMPYQVPRHLVPPVEALPRRTPVTSGGELEAIRARAAVELLDDFRTTAPHLDRHSSTR
ncbi:hypothetical protein ADL25_24395 [Streptomyces sp. NRRL F-5122]|uniref:hypothetical protein n=1 Tax=Streptomyces sp. NRRL F-5122 TaxID=1609098 RepID=UPI00074105B6|nr:hypothetical protein [Streptomyces sp. NRRL F-5122]KUJ38407.1 hypothetical protein ADL25_24395 [Streptomyces sp. NRRL F-5122]